MASAEQALETMNAFGNFSGDSSQRRENKSILAREMVE